MDERRLRYPAGSNGDGTTHRVGLTRHCLASGAVQLPFALRDSLPEGDLLAYDVVRDETVALSCEPPRRLSGLEAFFAEHELQVNDQLELRLQGGEVRLAPRPRSRRSGDPGDTPAARRPSRWTSRIEPAPAPTQPAVAQRPDVVERIGSVTVRRLGAETLTAPPGSELPDPTESAFGQDAPTSSANAAGDIGSDEDIDALLVIGSDEPPEPAASPPLEARHPEAAQPDPVQPDPVQPEPVQPEPVQPEPGRPEPAPSEATPQERPTSSPRAQVARGAPRPGTVQQGGLFGQPTSEPPRRARRGRAPRRPPRTQPAPAEPPRVREQDLADPTRGATITSADAPRPTETPSTAPSRSDVSAEAAPNAAVPTSSAPPPPPTDVRPSPAQASVPDAAANEGSDAAAAGASLGDLRRRVVMWLLEPDTPVIVPYERVQERFDLGADRTREVLGMILETPPPTLRLTLLREGMLRVSRVTVEQEA